MYVLGVDIPLVEIVIGIGIISMIILIETIIVLVLITFHMKKIKRLEKILMRLERKGYKKKS